VSLVDVVQRLRAARAAGRGRGWASAAHTGRARATGAGRAPALRTRAVQLGRARIQPSAPGLNFINFLIYSIHYKFKNLCTIDLNSENYETNFVGNV
jgi:hypothetical protein